MTLLALVIINCVFYVALHTHIEVREGLALIAELYPAGTVGIVGIAYEKLWTYEILKP